MSENDARKDMAPVRRTADELSVVTRSQPQTVAVGRALGECLAEGDVLVLTGDLGAGKTQLTKGMAAGLGHPGEVTSPTFTLAHEYEGGRLPLFHFDFYRLDHPDDLLALGWDDYLDAGGVVVAEWADRFPALVPPAARWIELRHDGTGGDILDAHGAGGLRLVHAR